MTELDIFFKSADLIIKVVALVVGAIWAVYTIRKYRELKNWVQLDLDTKIHTLSRPENAKALSWDKKGKRIELDAQTHTHAVEILLKFTNKGKTRVKMFNIQVGINTMRPPDQAQFDSGDGHLHLTRILTSGNLIPEFRVEGEAVEEASFYYIEPEVEQTITHLCLISHPRELIQVFAMFNFEKRRLFPERVRGANGMFPHTAARTFPLETKVITEKDI